MVIASVLTTAAAKGNGARPTSTPPGAMLYQSLERNLEKATRMRGVRKDEKNRKHNKKK